MLKRVVGSSSSGGSGAAVHCVAGDYHHHYCHPLPMPSALPRQPIRAIPQRSELWITPVSGPGHTYTSSGRAIRLCRLIPCPRHGFSGSPTPSPTRPLASFWALFPPLSIMPDAPATTHHQHHRVCSRNVPVGVLYTLHTLQAAPTTGRGLFVYALTPTHLCQNDDVRPGRPDLADETSRHLGENIPSL